MPPKLNTEEFIRRSILIHGELYDYVNAEYVNYNTKIIIYCREHGDFKQTPDNHLQGKGCPDCGVERTNRILKSRKKTTEEFVKRSIDIHGNIYDYSETVYETFNEKVVIICKIHGVFKQTPSNHLSGYGCLKCGGNIKKTTEEFVKQSIHVHGNKYDYSKSKYNGSHKKIIIICKIHGEFEQTPSNHLSGHDCFECGTDRTNRMLKSRKKTTEEFIKQSTDIHGNNYNYSKTVYDSSNEKVIIICKIHGEFEQTPNNHLSGKGCFECGRERTKQANKQSKLTTEEFIEQAIDIHENNYDYSKIIYKSTIEKVIIVCKIHGEFEQTPNNHLSGKGCSKCSKIGYSQKAIKWLKEIEENENIEIQTAENGGEQKIKFENFATKSKIYKNYVRLDGIDHENLTAYEFHGCIYHGCPKCFPNRNDISPVNKKTHEENYLRTKEKERIVDECGFNLVVMWECEYSLNT
jgi:hypothetical protein